MLHVPSFERVLCSLRSLCRLLFYFNATGVVSCGGRKTSPRTLSKVQIVLHLSFKIIWRDNNIYFGSKVKHPCHFHIEKFCLAHGLRQLTQDT